MGKKKIDCGDIILSKSTEEVLLSAEKAARNYGSAYIGSEHLIFAMLNTPHCTAYKLLKSCKATEAGFGEYFVRSIDKSCNVDGYTPRTKRTLEHAVALADGGTLRTEHMLLALLSVECLAVRILRVISANLDRLVSVTSFLVETGVEQ